MKTSLQLAFVVVLCSGLGAVAGEAGYARPDLLLEPTELAQPDVAKRFVILDVRAKNEYDQGHVPGARRVDHDTWKAAFEEGKDAAGWSERIGNLGIGPGSKVVVYDDKAMKDAGRIWWILAYWGVKEVRLLNGGWKGWNAAKLPVTKAAPSVSAARFRATPRAERLATKAGILDSLKGNRLQIVDARTTGEYCGIDKKKNKKGGAIPGAKHLDWTNLVDQQTHRFKSPAELRRLFDEAGIDLDRPSATYCQSGGRAAVMAFAMELMGARNVRNYFRSWKEWGNAKDTPVFVPQRPKQKQP